MRSIIVLLPEEGESWKALVRRIKKSQGDVLLILSGADERLGDDAQERDAFFTALQNNSGRVRIATRNPSVIEEARSRAIRVIDHANDLKKFLQDHEQLEEAMRVFSPHIWRQQLRSRLQSMGLLTLPKLRIWVLILVSILLFFFVFFRLLPSATIRVKPREDVVTQTSNVFLVLSGATVDIPKRVRTVELKPITVNVSKTITIDEISKEFIGESARVYVTVHNNASEFYGLREGTRILNQAGMVFRIQDPIKVLPGETVEVLAIADDKDQYDEIIGDRGNVPAKLRWDFPGLAPKERTLVYAINERPAQGGTMAYRNVLHEEDLLIAENQLKQDLLGVVNRQVDEDIELYNAEHPDQILTRLYYDELTKSAFTGFVLPTQFIGQKVDSVPVQGSVIFTAYAYDEKYILDMLRDELLTHTEAGKTIREDSIELGRMITHVIDYEDDLSWIKLTVDLSGTQYAILDPLSPSGARFAKEVRESVLGLPRDDASRIVKNMQVVEKAEVSLWPPWSNRIPTIPSHISIEVLEK